MAANINHIIRHAAINLEVSGKDNGMEMQKETGQWMERLFEKLEPAFDSLAGRETWLSLDSLDIEIKVSGNRWQEEALEKVTAKIVEAISLHASHTIADTHFSAFTPERHFEEIFLFYLQNGYLPWNTGADIKSDWRQQVNQLFTQKESRFAAKLMAMLQQFPAATKRLLAAVPLLVLTRWMEKTPDNFEPGKIQQVTDLNNLLVLLNEWHHLPRKKEAENLLLNLLVHNQINIPDTQVSLLFGQGDRKIAATAKAGELWQPLSPVFIKLKEILAGEKPKEIIYDESFVKTTGEQPAPKPGESGLAGQASAETGTSVAEKPGISETEEAIYIENAGLVIVAPFLPMLFKNLELWKDGKWQNREQAVCLVNYLATGQTSMEEYELVLPKILCGMHPGEVADPHVFSPDEQWKQEAEMLLQSVIEHWSILKDTSVEGLRASFLSREGKLVQKEGDWQMTVEQKAFDMLLQQLPWNISMIRLPWMEGMIYTTWIH